MAALNGYLVRAMLRALSLLPLEGQRRLGRWIGRLAWRLQLQPARITRINIARAFPELDEPARQRLSRESLEHTGMLAAELGAVYRWPPRRWAALTVSSEGDELIDAARAAGRGVLILVPHYGNWEYLALVLGRYRTTALYGPPRQRALEPVIREARSRAGCTLLPIDAGGLRGFYRALARGEVVALLPDQVPARGAGVYAPFFGDLALTMTFVHRLLQRTDPLVLLGAAERTEGGFALRFVDLGGALRVAQAQDSATAMNRAVEALALRDPPQYQWEYKRFKRPPPGGTNPYRTPRPKPPAS